MDIAASHAQHSSPLRLLGLLARLGLEPLLLCCRQLDATITSILLLLLLLRGCHHCRVCVWGGGGSYRVLRVREALSSHIVAR